MHRSVSIGANGATPPIAVMRRQQPVSQSFHVQSEHSKTHHLTQEIEASAEELESLSDEAITGGQGVNDRDIESVLPSYVVFPVIHSGTIGTARVRLPRDLMLYAACFVTMGLMGVFVLITILNCAVPTKAEDLTVGGNFQPVQLKTIPTQMACPAETKHEAQPLGFK